MGYRIVYGEDPFRKPTAGKSHLRLLTAAFALAFVILVRCVWPQGTAILRQVFLPRENAAIAQMATDIQAGEPIGDAVAAFCQSIVEDALAEGN